MNFSLKNDNVSITVNSLGAELQSLLAGSTEYLWHGDSDIWAGRAPVLFPIVGALKNSQMTVGENSYSLPRHGLARRATFECIKNEPNHLLFRLQSDAESLKVYPWEFTLDIGYTLHASQLNISYSVTHNTETTDKMLFTIGSHPAFALPLNTHSIEQFSIRFSHREQLLKYPLTDAGLLAIKGEPFPLQDSQLILHKNTFDNDALVFKDIKSTSISLWHGDVEKVRVNTGGAPHLGLWAKPGAPFVCIEPWFGYSDDENASGSFRDKPELKSLSGRESFHTEWSIELPSI